MDQDDLNEIIQTVPTISNVVVERMKTGSIESDDAEVEAQDCGTTPEYLWLLQEGAKVKVKYGRFLESIEAAEGSAVIVLSDRLAKKLFTVPDPVGQSVVLERRQLTVVGVMTDGASWGSAVVRDAHVPLTLFGPESDQNAPFPYDRFRFRVEEMDQVEATRDH